MFTNYTRKEGQTFWGSRYDFRVSSACIIWNHEMDLITLFTYDPDKYFLVASEEEQVAYLLHHGPRAKLSSELKNALAEKAREPTFNINISFTHALETDALESVQVNSKGIFTHGFFPIYRVRHETRLISLLYYTARYAPLSVEERSSLLARIRNLKSVSVQE